MEFLHSNLHRSPVDCGALSKVLGEPHSTFSVEDLP